MLQIDYEHSISSDSENAILGSESPIIRDEVTNTYALSNFQHNLWKVTSKNDKPAQPDVHPFNLNTGQKSNQNADDNSFMHSLKMDINKKTDVQKDKDDSMQDVQELFDSLKGITKRHGVDKLDFEINSPSRMVNITPHNEPPTMDLELIPVSPILDPTKKSQENKVDDIEKFFQ